MAIKAIEYIIVGNYISVQNICSLSLWYPIPKGGLYIPSLFQLGMAIRLPVVKDMEVEEMCPSSGEETSGAMTLFAMNSFLQPCKW